MGIGIREAAAVGMLAAALAGCGGGERDTAAVRGVGGDDRRFAALVAAIEEAKVAVCEPEESSAYIPLPAPQAAAARESSYFRYAEGRIYEFGPCQLPAGGRNELRAFRYEDGATRDQALVDVTRRNTRPTSTFAYQDLYAVEIWSPEPSLDSPAGQAAAQVHSAIARVPRARHHDVAAAASSSCPPDPAPGQVVSPGFLFCPAEVTVAAGSEVRWTNADAAPHSLTATGAEPAFDSGTLTTGQTFTFRLDRPGTYQYFCRLHPSMRGTVTVIA